MKKKTILVLVFCTLILATLLTFAVIAFRVYRSEMEDPNIDIMPGFGAVMTAGMGGLLVWYECDLFYTVFCLSFGRRGKVRAVSLLLANIMLLLFLVYLYLPEMDMELRQYEWLLPALFVAYLIFRVVALFLSVSGQTPESE